ncbi:MAG: helix-turn-helix domain-containing protein [Syntrophobacteraceae bacterium]|jgi:excisionase family DNA binding protein
MNIGSNAKNSIKAYYTPDELAEYFAVSKRTVYRRVNKRKLPFLKFGGLLRFKIEDIEKQSGTESVEPIKR